MFMFPPHVLQQIPESTSYNLAYMEAIILGMLAAGMPAYFAMDHTRDREVSGLIASSASYLLPLVAWTFHIYAFSHIVLSPT